jgi:hypothetical protein
MFFRTKFLNHRYLVYPRIQKEKFETAKFELHQLLAQPSLKGVPLLVVSVS